MSLIKVCEVTKTYKGGDGVVEALKAVNLEIAVEEFLALMGPSGSGKRTTRSFRGTYPPTPWANRFSKNSQFSVQPPGPRQSHT